MDLNTKSLREKIESRMVALDERKADLERKIEDIGRQKKELRGSLEVVKTMERHARALDTMIETGEFDLGEEAEAEEEESPESETLKAAEDKEEPAKDALKAVAVTTLTPVGGSEEEDEDLMMVENLFAAPAEGADEAASGNGNEPTLESVLKEVETIGDSKGLADDAEKAFPKASDPESIVPKFLKKYL